MNREELIAGVKALPFAKEDFWVITGGAMVLYGLRDKTHDIALIEAHLAKQNECH